MTTTTAKRLDPHSPTNLRTEDYDFAGCLDWGGGASADPLGAAFAARERVALINRVIVEPGRKWAHVHPNGQCDHCGAHIRYAALLVHTPTDTVVEVGETCLENRFERATSEFQKLRKAAELDRQRQHIKKWVAQFALDYPDLAFMATNEIPESMAWNNFVQDLAYKLHEYGGLSDKQIAALRKVKATCEAQAIKRAAQADLPKTDVPEGRLVVTGEVLSLKSQESQFGWTTKMLVLDKRGFKVWGTRPANSGFDRGCLVRFSAKLERSKDDSTFGFFSRPTQAAVLASVAD